MRHYNVVYVVVFDGGIGEALNALLETRASSSEMFPDAEKFIGTVRKG